jgi:hypothetical protein
MHLRVFTDQANCRAIPCRKTEIFYRRKTIMTNEIIELVAAVAARLAVTAIGLFGTWLLTKLAKKIQLQNVSIATRDLIVASQTTVLELQQTVVEGLKEKSADGKLTADEIKALGETLLCGAKNKMSDSALALLEAAGTDVNAIITSAGEAMITQMKMGELGPIIGIPEETEADNG